MSIVNDLKKASIAIIDQNGILVDKEEITYLLWKGNEKKLSYMKMCNEEKKMI